MQRPPDVDAPPRSLEPPSEPPSSSSTHFANSRHHVLADVTSANFEALLYLPSSSVAPHSTLAVSFELAQVLFFTLIIEFPEWPL